MRDLKHSARKTWALFRNVLCDFDLHPRTLTNTKWSSLCWSRVLGLDNTPVQFLKILLLVSNHGIFNRSLSWSRELSSKPWSWSRPTDKVLVSRQGLSSKFQDRNLTRRHCAPVRFHVDRCWVMDLRPQNRISQCQLSQLLFRQERHLWNFHSEF